MSQIIKKLVSSFVALTTIAWSVGVGTFALPGAASAATLNAGDLIKASGPAVYYYAADQKRYVFPNFTTYASWYQDFSSVKTISDAELAAVMIGGNVTIRPGTKLVKITTDPKVYAVTAGGQLHWVESEAVATSLYGSAWASRVVDVPDAFFVNYSVGSSVATAVHPDGSLVMMGGSRYVIMGGQARLLSDAAFAANGFNAADVIATTITYPMGAAVNGRESALADTVSAAGSVTPVGGSVSVALASDTPAGNTVPENATGVQLAKYVLTAGSAAATVTGLKFHRVGVGGSSDIANVYLYDANGARLTTGRSVNSATNMVEFNSLNLSIPAGQSVAVVLQADFNASSSGGQHSFEIMDAASVVISGTGSVSGSFPVRGNVFSVGNALSARLDVQKGTQPTNPNIGAADVEISNFKLTANTNDIEVRRITLLQAGSISNTDLSNLKLYQGTTVVASAAALVGDKIVLNFDTPFLLTNGTTKTFSLHAAVAGRAARTIRTYAEYTTDVYAIDKVYNAGAFVCIATSTLNSCQGSFDGNGGNYVEVTTQGGQLTLNFNGPTTQNVAKGQQDVVLYKFSLVSPDNQVEIRNIDFKIQGQVVGAGTAGKLKGTGTSCSATNGTEYFRDIKIKNLDTGATVMGPTSLSGSLSNCATDSGYITLTDSFNVNPGQVMNLGITADLANSEDVTNEFFGSGTSTYKVILGDSSGALFGSSDVRIVNTGEFLATDKIVPNSTISGNNFTVKSSSLSVSLASTPSSGTVVKKQSMVPSVGLVLTAGAQSDVLVTSMKLTGAASTTVAWAASELHNVITSCALMDGTTQVGTAQSPDTTLGTMNITNMNLSVPRGTSKTLILDCTTDSVVANTPNGDKYSVGIAASGDVTAQDQDSNSVSASLTSGVVTNAGTSGQAVVQTVLSSGTLTLATDNLRQSTILVAGGDVWQNFAQFRATAQNEDVTIDRMAVTSTGDSANFTQVAIAKDGAVKGWDILPAGSYTAKDIDLSQNPVTVPKNGSVLLQVWGKLASVQSSSSVNGATTGVARSGNTMSLGLAGNITTGEWDTNYNDKLNVRAVGAASGDRVYATSTNMTGGIVGNTFVLRKSVPTVTRQTLSSTTLAAGPSDLYKMQVSADPAGSIALKKITFNFSKSTSSGSSLSVSNFRLRRGSTDMATGDYTILDTDGNDLKTGAWDMTSSTGQIFVAFTGEETISGSGNVYTLYATVAGPISGDSINVSLNRTGNAGVFTGYLTDTQMAGAGFYGPNITTSSTATDAANLAGTFVWSDLSEVPHYSNSSGSNRSRDWMNDLYVEDLTQTQVLSR